MYVKTDAWYVTVPVLRTASVEVVCFVISQTLHLYVIVLAPFLGMLLQFLHVSVLM